MTHHHQIAHLQNEDVFLSLYASVHVLSALSVITIERVTVTAVVCRMPAVIEVLDHLCI